MSKFEGLSVKSGHHGCAKFVLAECCELCPNLEVFLIFAQWVSSWAPTWWNVLGEGLQVERRGHEAIGVEHTVEVGGEMCEV